MSKTWRYLIEHDQTRANTFSEAKRAFARLKDEMKDSAKVEAGPMSEAKPNVLRIRIMGDEIIVGVLFQDRMALCSITAPDSLAWAKTLVEPKVKDTIKQLLEDAGSRKVLITEY